jgi:peptidoglycan/xylan/chitin deacetylase (PgdA/CDA1 family)
MIVKSRRIHIRTLAVAVGALALSTLAACGASSVHARWVAATQRAPALKEQGPAGDDAPGDDSSAPPVPRDFLAHIPTFPAAPPPQPVALPAGPSAPFLSHIQTTQPVAFLTIDDGWVKQSQAIELVRAAHVPVTLFLTINAIRNAPDYFKQLQSAGAVIEAHTITHTDLKGKSYDFQRREACGSADQLGAIYGRRPLLFRPPFGDEDPTTLRAVHDCSMRAAFFWKETVNNGAVRFQVGHRIQPGDIVLMHFRASFVADFLAALQAIHDAGLTPALLESYLSY